MVKKFHEHRTLSLSLLLTFTHNTCTSTCRDVIIILNYRIYCPNIQYSTGVGELKRKQSKLQNLPKIFTLSAHYSSFSITSSFTSVQYTGRPIKLWNRKTTVMILDGLMNMKHSNCAVYPFILIN